METTFNIGDIIYGFCNGYFGRDDYNTKICTFITPNYAIFQYLDGDIKGMAICLNNYVEIPNNITDKWRIENDD